MLLIQKTSRKGTSTKINKNLSVIASTQTSFLLMIFYIFLQFTIFSFYFYIIGIFLNQEKFEYHFFPRRCKFHMLIVEYLQKYSGTLIRSTILATEFIPRFWLQPNCKQIKICSTCLPFVVVVPVLLRYITHVIKFTCF